MRRPLVSAIVIALVMLACGETETGRILQGTVTGADGVVPPLAHVHLLALGDDIGATVQTVQVGENGSFRLELPDEGYYDLLVTAVNHRSLRLPVVSDGGFELTDVRLVPAPYRYNDPLEDIQVIGDWADFSRREAEAMIPQDDGTFAYEREVEADTLAYQLLNAEQSGRSINGTDSDYYIYDGGGDYLSVVSVEAGTAVISFDPEKARIIPTDDVPLVDFGEGGDGPTEAWEIRRRWLEETDRRDRAFQEYYEEHGTYDGFEYDMSDIRQYLLGRMARADGRAARKYAAIVMAGVLDMGVPLEDEEARAVAELLPVTDRMWAAQPAGFLEIFGQTYGHDRMVDLFEDNLDRVVADKVRAAMLLELGLQAKGAGDSARQREIYEDLIQNQPDVNAPYISYRIKSELDPDLKITSGKPAPEFELVLLDQNRAFSRASMKGKYYLIDFWATWCGPCVREMAHLHDAYERFGGSNFEILSISLDQRVEDISGFRSGKWKMPWLHAFAEGMFSSDVATLFEVSGIPKPVLIDPEGTIVAAGLELRGDKLEETLASYLAD
jgi:thiol-disulfide isomerase/thioredoxin